MGEYFSFRERLEPMVREFVNGYLKEPLTQHIDRRYLPSREKTIQLTELLLELVYPGFFGRQNLTQYNVPFHVGDLIPRVGDLVYTQILNCLCYLAEAEDHDPRVCEELSGTLTARFIEQIPHIRTLLAGDVRAAYTGDPAAINHDEVILAYPGLFAITVYRLAHEMYRLDIPLMPRIMSEWAHMMTGVDIHPGASIGQNFFIDHGTGVVIGETTTIGDNVKVYQGVTLGALSIPKDERGRAIKGGKRHPTIEDDVTIYANAIILGGQTVIGQGSVIGGSVFVTTSVPPGCTVTFKPPELHFRTRGERPDLTPDTPAPPIMPDYQI